MGPVVRVLLTATDATAGEWPAVRERGSELERELRGSALKARVPAERAPADTVRVATDGRSVVDIGAEVAPATGWAGQG